MNARKVLGHIGLTALMLAVLVGLPMWKYIGSVSPGQTVDAASGATIALPDKPSGDFIVLINTARHSDTLGDWGAFFRSEDFPVIFEDISCMVAQGDASGQQMAERFQAQLPENQMMLREENPTLLVSKAEAGYIDVAVFSREMADALELNPDEALVTVLTVTGGEN